MTRFDENSRLWQNFKSFYEGLFRIWQNFEPASSNCHANEQFFNAVNGQILN